MKQDEIDRCLVLVYQSRNNAMDVNYNLHCDRVDRLCLRPEAKAELVRVLRKLADDVERKYPCRDSGVAEWIEKVTDKAGSHHADWLVLEAAGELLNDLHIRLCHARMLLLTCKCPSIRGAIEQDSYGIFDGSDRAAAVKREGPEISRAVQ